MGQGRARPLGTKPLDARDADDELAADSRYGGMQGAARRSGARTSHRTRICTWQVGETLILPGQPLRRERQRRR